MRKAFIVLAVLFSLTGCSYLHVHKMDIQQGNVITPEMVHSIHTGMTESQVKNIAGYPVLTNVFDGQRVDYVYTYKPGYGEGTEKYLTLTFRNGRLIDIKGNMYSQFMK